MKKWAILLISIAVAATAIAWGMAWKQSHSELNLTLGLRADLVSGAAHSASTKSAASPIRLPVLPPIVRRSSRSELPKLQAKLIGTSVGDQPEDHQAIVEDEKLGQILTLKIGDHLQERTLTHIARGFVRLQQPGGEEELLFLEDASHPGAVIQYLGADEYRIDRAQLVEAIKGDVTNLWSQSQVTPHIESFRLLGVKLSQVQPNSLVERAGLMVDDIVTEVEGASLNSVSAALEAYHAARRSQDITVKIERQGEMRTLRYLMN